MSGRKVRSRVTGHRFTSASIEYFGGMTWVLDPEHGFWYDMQLLEWVVGEP